MERNHIHHQSIDLSRDAPLVGEHGTGGLQQLREDYFEADRVQVVDGQVFAAIRQVVAVVEVAFAGCCEVKVYAPGLARAIDRTAHTRPHIHCRRKDAATHPTQIVPGSIVPALFSDLAQRPHDTGLVSSAGYFACDLEQRVRDVVCDFGGWFADEVGAARCSSRVWDCRHSRRSIGGSWGLAGGVVVGQTRVGGSE